MPKVDVIMPVRNGEKYISRAISSLVPDAEFINKLIVINDGSNDRTASILSDLRWNGRLQIIHQPPLGIVRALNGGLNAAETALVARMDADDVSLPGRLKAQIAYLERSPKVAAVGSQVLLIDADGFPTGDTSNFPLASREVRRQLYEHGRCVVSHPSVVMRKDAVLACGAYRAPFEHAEDFDLWLRLSEHYPIENIADVFVHHRVHAKALSEQFRSRQSFSRDLALYAARERARSGTDPCDGLSGIPNFEELMSRTGEHGTIMQDLGTAYHAIDAIFEKRRAAMTVAAARAISALAKERYLGQSRRNRYALLRKAAWTSLMDLHFRTALATYSAFVQCRVADSKFFRRMLENSRAGEARPRRA